MECALWHGYSSAKVKVHLNSEEGNKIQLKSTEKASKPWVEINFHRSLMSVIVGVRKNYELIEIQKITEVFNL